MYRDYDNFVVQHVLVVFCTPDDIVLFKSMLHELVLFIQQLLLQFEGFQMNCMIEVYSQYMHNPFHNTKVVCFVQTAVYLKDVIKQHSLMLNCSTVECVRGKSL